MQGGTYSYTAPTVVDEKLKVQQSAAAPGEPCQDLVPASLLLICRPGQNGAETEANEGKYIQQWAN